MKHRILAYCDHQNSITCLMGCIFTIHSIAFHVCKGAQRYSMVDFLTGHRLGTDISSEHRLTGQVLFPNSKNSSIMYETLSNLLWHEAISSHKVLVFFFLQASVHRPVARLFKRGVHMHMCMGLITIMCSQQGLEYFLLLYYTISMYYCNMYNVLIKKTKLIKKQLIIISILSINYLFVLYPNHRSDYYIIIIHVLVTTAY